MFAFYYKCRWCGKVFRRSTASEENVLLELEKALERDDSLYEPAPLRALHVCADSRIGIADLVGVKEVATKPGSP